MADSKPQAPLAGVRVLDLTQVWAGPLNAQFLADFGAEVIKAESRERAAELFANRERRRVDKPEAKRESEVQGFETILRNRRPVSLDISREEGRAIALQLAEQCDIVVENFTARLLREWGLTYERFAEANPRIIMVSMSPAGQVGPWSGVLTYGPSLSALFGAKSLLGYPDDPMPFQDMSEADPIAGIYGFYATLSALRERDVTGKGRHVDLAQGETVLTHGLEAILCAQVGGIPPRGNRHSAMAPQGMYRCAGDDEWVAITVEHDADWRTLAGIIRQPALAEAYPTVEDRLANHDAIDAAIERWTSRLSPFMVESRLAAAGLAVLPLLHNIDQFEHPHLRERRATAIDVPDVIPDAAELGNAMPIKLSRTPAALHTPEAVFFEPQVQVLRDLGFEEDRLEKLISEGVL